MHRPLVSFILPCYNDAIFIEQAVESALEQTVPVEVIVIDDGSNESTKVVLASIAHKIDLLITQENQGQSKARNVGVKAAKGEFIVTLDSDDFFEAEFTEKSLEIFRKEEQVKIVTCQSNLIYDDGQIKEFLPNGGDISHFIFSNGALGSSMFKKIDWNACGGYDELMRSGWEDWEFYIRLLANGGKCVVINEPLFNYRKRNNSTTSRANKNRHQLLSYIINKNSELYKANFHRTIEFLINKMEREENEKNKILGRREVKCCKSILDTFRKVKKIFKK